MLSCGDEAVAGEGGEISARSRDWDFVFSETYLFVRKKEFLVEAAQVGRGCVRSGGIWVAFGLRFVVCRNNMGC